MAYDDFLQSFFHAMAMPPSQPQSPFGAPQVAPSAPPRRQDRIAQMPYDDYLKSQGLMPATSVPIPGMQAPITLMPAAGTNLSPQTILANSFQTARNNAVKSQENADLQAQVAAKAAYDQKVADEKKRSRGGGIFSPISRMVHAFQDYPEQFGGALQNAASNPFSLGSWGGAAMSFASPAFAGGSVLSDYMKMGLGSVLYHAATG